MALARFTVSEEIMAEAIERSLLPGIIIDKITSIRRLNLDGGIVFEIEVASPALPEGEVKLTYAKTLSLMKRWQVYLSRIELIQPPQQEGGVQK